MKKSYEIDMCNGPLLGKILVFSIPLMLSGILQLLFNAADIIVVGRFAGSTALAAVGSTASLINLMINVFVGLSVGVNVLAARYYGAQKEKDIQDTVHTAIMMAILSGLFLVLEKMLQSLCSHSWEHRMMYWIRRRCICGSIFLECRCL